MIEISPGSINYGLIQFGHSTAQTIQLTNVSKCKVDFLVKQIVQVRDNGFVVSSFHGLIAMQLYYNSNIL